jgi:hypothetical protein
MPSEKRFLSLAETTQELCISIASLHRIIARGELTVSRIGGRTLVERRDLEDYIAAAKTSGSQGGGRRLRGPERKK